LAAPSEARCIFNGAGERQAGGRRASQIIENNVSFEWLVYISRLPQSSRASRAHRRVKLVGAPSSRALGGSIGKLKGLLALEVREPLNFENFPREDVDLPLLLYGEEPHVDGFKGDRMDEVAEGDPGLHLPGEPNPDRLGHVQGHDARGSTESNQATSSRKRNTNGEAGVGVASGSDRVGQKHPVQPGVDDAISRAEGNPPAVADKVGKRVVGNDVHRLGVSGSVAEALHDQIGTEAQAREVLELVASHGAGGVLGANRSHLGLAVLAGENSRNAARLPDHLLGEGVAVDGLLRIDGLRRAKKVRSKLNGLV